MVQNPVHLPVPHLGLLLRLLSSPPLQRRSLQIYLGLKGSQPKMIRLQMLAVEDLWSQIKKDPRFY